MDDDSNKTFNINTLPYYIVEKVEHHRVLEGRFWNCQGKQIAIVAAITHFGERGDWSAYIGTDAPDSYSEEETCKYTAKHGCKLSEKDAKHFFPEITLPYRY